MYHSFGKTNSRGCSIYIQKKLTYKLINTITDTEGRLLIVNIELSDTVYTLINIYAHNDRTQRNAFFYSLNKLILAESRGIIIFGGDFNDTLTKKDRQSNAICTKKTLLIT